jgi:hypothetical protein
VGSSPACEANVRLAQWLAHRLDVAGVLSSSLRLNTIPPYSNGRESRFKPCTVRVRVSRVVPKTAVDKPFVVVLHSRKRDGQTIAQNQGDLSLGE